MHPTEGEMECSSQREISAVPKWRRVPALHIQEGFPSANEKTPREGAILAGRLLLRTSTSRSTQIYCWFLPAGVAHGRIRKMATPLSGDGKSAAGRSRYFWPRQYSTVVLRMNSWPSEGVGEARKISAGVAGNAFSATSSSFGPGLMTIVAPASFVT